MFKATFFAVLSRLSTRSLIFATLSLSNPTALFAGAGIELAALNPPSTKMMVNVQIDQPLEVKKDPLIPPQKYWGQGNSERFSENEKDFVCNDQLEE